MTILYFDSDFELNQRVSVEIESDVVIHAIEFFMDNIEKKMDYLASESEAEELELALHHLQEALCSIEDARRE